MPYVHGERKTVYVTFRVNPSTHAAAKAEAAKLGLSVDEWAQTRFLAALLEKPSQQTATAGDVAA